MLKKLDWYTIKTFFGPFFFIFSVLFFIFMVQFAWQEMDEFAGKGLDLFTIFKLLFYLGISVIQFVLPLTVLLSAIMTFGGFGEKYELAAMKSTGISLGRIMLPLGVLVFGISCALFYFSDTLVPLSQRKAKNMLLNIAQTSPALNFDPGIFIDGVPGFSMKITDRSGDKGENLEGVFIHKDVSAFENQQTIIAKSGLFVPADDKRYLKLALYNGFIYEDDIKGKNRIELKSQENRSVEFDTLVQFFNIASVIEKAIEKEQVTDHYKFMTSRELYLEIDTLRTNDSIAYAGMTASKIQNLVYGSAKLDSLDSEKEYVVPFQMTDLDEENKNEITAKVIKEIERDRNEYKINQSEIENRVKFFSRHAIILNRNFSNALMCLIFFLIGAPLGAIIRKGGVGMPVVVAIVIFVLFYLMYMTSENLSKNGVLDPLWAAWIPIIVFLPLGLFLTYKATTDSAIFDISLYMKPINKIKDLLGKNKNTEHKRYQ